MMKIIRRRKESYSLDYIGNASCGACLVHAVESYSKRATTELIVSSTILYPCCFIILYYSGRGN